MLLIGLYQVLHTRRVRSLLHKSQGALKVVRRRLHDPTFHEDEIGVFSQLVVLLHPAIT